MQRFPTLPKVSELLRLYNLRARSQLGQNFILDLNVAQRIVDNAGGITGKYVCEIGPGPGSLTRCILLQEPRCLTVIEKDSRFLPMLDQLGSYSDNLLVVRQGDVLKYDLQKEFTGVVPLVRWKDEICFLHLIGNLPFNISLPLLVKFLKQISYRTGPFKFGRTPMTLIFQEEVGLRIVAPPYSPHRSRLSVIVQAYCDAELVYRIPSTVYVPRPKVNAATVHFKPLIKPRISVDFEVLDLVLRSLFNQKRSSIRKSLNLLFPEDQELREEILKSTGINTSLRISCLTLEDINNICIGCLPHLNRSENVKTVESHNLSHF
ncbi:Dimethyladenosine transferase 1, mitochondrial-like [Oopsacas minuta]|uniref:rRNA adenine N(6)-methyltransferase n=1 Tax=Oopsacas minuta TaxID=111878 RepID=A0AAV7JJ73_9METZ|nr:Dimethyladenosine transferase 1, mitochondrial-like [Oopsacas minuta]